MTKKLTIGSNSGVPSMLMKGSCGPDVSQKINPEAILPNRLSSTHPVGSIEIPEPNLSRTGVNFEKIDDLKDFGAAVFEKSDCAHSL